jgi:DNA-binding GntR family transcriptional regulator
MPLDVDELDVLYAQRILAEALAVRLSVQRFRPADIRSLESLCQKMSKAAAKDDFESWQTNHRDFHRRLVGHGGDELKQTLRRLAERSERYLYMLLRLLRPAWWRRGEAEHAEILDCCRRGDAPAAVNLIAGHLARTARQLCGMMAADRDPAAVRAAVELLGAEGRTATIASHRGRRA